MNQVILKIEGMNCGHCKMSVEKALSKVEGVVSATVNLEKKEAFVEGNVSFDTLKCIVEDIGYQVVE